MKIYPYTIPKQPGDNLIVQIDQAKKFYGHLHQHKEIQLSYIVSGSGRLIIGNNVTNYSSGDFIGIGSNIPHLFQSSESSSNSHMISLFFLKDAFGIGFFESPEMLTIKPVLDTVSQGIKLKDTDGFILKLLSPLNNSNKFEAFLAMLQLLNYFKNKKRAILTAKDYYPKISTNQGQRLQVVFDYVLNNFSEPIQLENVAAKVHMGKNSFCRFFKQRTNKTFFNFLTEVRIQHACNLLVTKSDLTINQIALESGYQTLSNFNRQFKEIKGMSPKTFRNSSVSKI